MARPTRIDFPGALFHVMGRGNQKQRSFRDASDYARYENLLQRYHQRYGFHVYAYVLMPNHIHLLVETDRVPLAKIMQGIQQSYTAYFNKKYRLTGHCFQGRYKAILCDRDAYLLTLVRYLHLNPVRAGLVQGPERWGWSSHKAYLESAPSSWVSVDQILGHFGRGGPRRRTAYRRFIADGMGEGHREDLYELVEQRYLGSEAFIETAERKGRIRPEHRRLRLTVEECVRATCEVTGVRPLDLRTPSRVRNLATARAIAAYVGYDLAGIQYSETARALRRAAVTLSLQVQRLRQRLDSNPTLARLVGRVEERLRAK
ncbi:MAG TPA: transposase [Candidatus Methylomirabilis sp.]